MLGLTKRIAFFVGGTLFGSAGFDLLSSKDARKVYTHITAAALRCKDKVMTDVENVQECCSDILADAKAINEKRAAKDKAEFIKDDQASGEEIKNAEAANEEIKNGEEA